MITAVAAPLNLHNLQTIGELEAAVHVCRRCRLGKARSCAVPGDGPAPCDILLVGEGPGEAEDKQGVSFVGRSGRLLREKLVELGQLDPGAIYWTNMVKCRSFAIEPSGKKKDDPPHPDCIRICRPYLDAQIRLVAPRAVVVVGSTACTHLLGRPIAQCAGSLVYDQVIKRYYLPLIHPAAAVCSEDYMDMFLGGMRGIRYFLDVHPEIRREAAAYAVAAGA
ncbi:MAG: uracil-DNA glycosylase [bacterium]|nr:uracil-DNA glycosylase [bacterium]